jgi:hypothetical protein
VREEKMLKKYQVFLHEWLEEHVKYLADKFDLSFSEMIRGQICFSTLTAVDYLYPEYKPDITVEEILEKFKEQDKNVLTREDMQRALSKIYFETRKAIEYGKEREEE